MAKAWKVTGVKPKKSYRRNAQIILPVRIDEVYSWADYIHEPANIRELHNMRISIKRVRYAMEFFDINYGDDFADCLSVFVDLQGLIGDIHDCDVIQEVLTDYVETIDHDETSMIGINALIRSYQEKRDGLYDQFIESWDKLDRENFREKLLAVINSEKLPTKTKKKEEPSRSEYVVGVDMGGTKILSAVISADGTILSREKIATRADQDSSAVIDRIAQSISGAIDQAGLSASEISSIGIGAPGPLDPETGVVIFAPNLGWTNVPLKSELEKRLSIPTFLDNDVNVGTLGEACHGVGRGKKNIVGIFVGTGIGGGLVLDGKLFHGASRTAGEVGHMVVKANGPRCGCGQRGCLEAISSRTGIARELKKSILEEKKWSVITELNDGNLDLVRSGSLSRAVELGDKLATKAMRRSAKYLGISIGSIVNFLNPEMIILGGGVIEAMGESYLRRIRRFAISQSLPSAMNGVQIVTAELGDDAGIIGAAEMARQRISDL